MSYQQKTLAKNFDGKTLVPLSVAREILEIREEIEKNEQHAGGQLELVYQAYKEIQEAHGHHAPKLDASCSGCTREMNKMLCNWFKKYDQGTIPQKAASGAFKSKPLKAIGKKKEPAAKKDVAKRDTLPEYEDMSYGELLTAFKSKSSKSEQDKINNGKPPKKAQILKYFGI